MDVFELRDRVVGDYADYVRSFLTISDSGTRTFVDDYLGKSSAAGGWTARRRRGPSHDGQYSVAWPAFASTYTASVAWRTRVGSPAAAGARLSELIQRCTGSAPGVLLRAVDALSRKKGSHRGLTRYKPSAGMTPGNSPARAGRASSPTRDYMPLAEGSLPWHVLVGRGGRHIATEAWLRYRGSERWIPIGLDNPPNRRQVG